jgi:hypothetical protein
MEYKSFHLELTCPIVELMDFRVEVAPFHVEHTIFMLEGQFSSMNGRYSCQKRESSSWKTLQEPPLKKETTNR